MGRSARGSLSFAFVKLQHLVQSFEELGAGVAPADAALRRALRLVVQLGATALPLCVRELAGSDARRACWAEVLLEQLGARPELHARVVAELRGLASEQSAHGETVRERARRMLGELGQRVSAPELDEPYQVSNLGSHRASGLASGLAGADAAPIDATRLRADMARMKTPAEVAQVADRMLAALESMALVLLVDELGEKDPARALRLADEILLHNDLDGQTRQSLRRVRAPLLMSLARPVGLAAVAAARAPVPAPGARVAALVGRHANGRMVAIVSQPVIVRPGERPARVRVMCMLLAADGLLNDGLYGEDFALRGLEYELLAPLRERGYRFATAGVDEAAELVRAGARAALCLGRVLPRAFYLGRDLLGIGDQHAAGLRTTDEDGPLLDRGLQFLDEALPERARPLLERYVHRVPESAEGHAGLARCLLALDDLEPARAQLIQAIALDPDNPLHHWNLAAIAHRQGRAGGCYLALLDYLDLVGEDTFDAGTGPCDARLETARAFVDEYDRLAQIEYPEARTVAIARAEDLAHRAQQRLSVSKPAIAPGARPGGAHDAALDAAVALLEQSVALVPSYHPAWAQLGMIFDRRGRADEAARCLRQALALRPGDAALIGALARIDRAAATRRERAASMLGARPAGDRPDPGRSETQQLR